MFLDLIPYRDAGLICLVLVACIVIACIVAMGARR